MNQLSKQKERKKVVYRMCESMNELFVRRRRTKKKKKEEEEEEEKFIAYANL